MFAAAVIERFPSAQVIHVAAQPRAFAMDVYIDSPWDKGFLSLIEKKCVELCGGDPEFESLEMAPAATAALFAQKNQKILCGRLPKDKRILVDVLRTGDFALPMKFDAAAQKSQDFVLDEARAVGCNIYRFRVAAGHEATFPSHYLFDGLQQGECGWSYLPKAEKARLQLQARWMQIVCEKGFEVVSTPMGVTWKEAAEQLENLGTKRAAQLNYLCHGPQELDYGPLTPVHGFQDQFYIELADHELENEVISSLQMMREISNIFCFETKLVLCVKGSAQESQVLQRAVESERFEVELDPENPKGEIKGTKLELRILDADGFAWPGPTLEIKRTQSGRGKSSKRALLGSLFGPWERWLALACQKGQGMPLLLREEQARVILLRPECKAYAEGVMASLAKAGLRVRLERCAETLSPKELSARVHRGLIEEVPYLIVIGSKEADSGLISWRECKAKVETTTTIDEFIDSLGAKH